MNWEQVTWDKNIESLERRHGQSRGIKANDKQCRKVADAGERLEVEVWRILMWLE